MKSDQMSGIVFASLLAGAGVVYAADTVATDPSAQTSTPSATPTARAGDTGALGTGTTAGASVRRPLSQALSSVEKNLAKHPDSKGLQNARERLLSNQAKIEERRAARQDAPNDPESDVDAVEIDNDAALTRQQRFNLQQARRADHFERKQQQRETRFERKQLERVAKAERPEKVERAEKVERPERMERAEKVERPEKQER